MYLTIDVAGTSLYANAQNVILALVNSSVVFNIIDDRPTVEYELDKYNNSTALSREFQRYLSH